MLHNVKLYKLQKLTLQNKIFILNTGIIFLAMCSLLILVTNIFSEYILETEQDNISKQIQLISNNLNMLVETTEDYLIVLSTDKMLTDELTSYRESEEKTDLLNLSTQVNIGKMVSSMIAPNTHIPCAIIATSGKVLYAGYMLEDELMYEYEQLKFDERSISIQRPIWGELQLLKYEDITTEYVFPVAKVIIDKDTGKKLGVATFFLREKSIEEVYEKANEGNIFYILDEEGIVISAVDKTLLGKTIEIEEKDGFLLSHESYEKMGWEIVCYTDMHSFYERKNAIITSNIVILVILICTAFVSAYLISYAITKPIYALVETMKKITADNVNLNIRAEEIENSEIGFLGKEFNQLMDRVKESEIQIYEHQRDRRKSDLLLLQSQIKPHFLYNTMETIASFIKLGYKDLALETVQNISMFYRKSLSGGNEIITVEEEIQIIEHYLKIQSLRYHTYLEYTIDVAEEIKHASIPKLILQPLVENSIYHGIKPKNDKGEIVIRAYRKEDNIVFEIFDTGVGMDDAALHELKEKLKCDKNTSNKNGFGLYSINERIQLFFGKEYGIVVESEVQEYTQITLVIPLKSFWEEDKEKIEQL